MNTSAQPAFRAGIASADRKPMADFASKRSTREWKTMETMIHIHCRDYHQPDGTLCAECQGLLDYATMRLERCRFGAQKPTCARCPVHCYQRTRREQVKAVMRYAGPRMVWEHPVMSLCHWLDGLRRGKSCDGSSI
ncbi:MAG TPA: nitrous oxide-stimulated promoter family protein [Verrucomicrobiae bacterium]|nr:nitrous oxide-stimulated promoter family protein [Verrucomicrobiae bacterium]